MMPVDAILIKQLINTMGLTPWGLVFYQNSIAGIFGLCCTIALELNSKEERLHCLAVLVGGGTHTWVPVVMSSLLGIAVSFFQMSVRRIISSTAFMVLGVSNKLLALLINQLVMPT